MSAQTDQNNMGSLSKQHEKTTMADLMVHFQRSEKCKFQEKLFVCLLLARDKVVNICIF